VVIGARIVGVPELANSGYVFASAEEARAAAAPAGGELLAGWAQEARRGDGLVIGGFCELGDDGLLYNSSALVDGSGVVAVYRKLHLWGEEPRWFEPGHAAAPVVETALGRIGLGVLLASSTACLNRVLVAVCDRCGVERGSSSRAAA
jgi:predicted amidohydrolase